MSLSGYIGGSVLVRLLGHPSFKSLEVTALVRSEDTAKKLKKFGVKTAIGTLQDHGLLESLAAKAHIVFSIVSITNSPYPRTCTKRYFRLALALRRRCRLSCAA